MPRFGLVLSAALAAILASAPAAAADTVVLVPGISTTPAPIVAGNAVLVTMTVRNAGTTAALTAGLRYVPEDGVGATAGGPQCPAGFTNEPPGLDCLYGTIAPGETVTATISIFVEPEPAAPVTSITHRVDAFAWGNVGGVNPTRAAARQTVPVTGGGAAAPEAGGPPGTGPRRDREDAMPRVTAVRLSPPRFRAARSGPGLGAASATGTVVTTTLDREGTQTFTVTRAAAGRRAGGRCAAPTARNRAAPRCTRWIAVGGSLTRSGVAGENRARFTGRLGGRALRPGRHRLTVTLRSTRGAVSAGRTATFTITR